MSRVLSTLSVACTICIADEPTAPPPNQATAEKRLEALGNLKDDLGLWIGMNSLECGGIEWARFDFKLMVVGDVKIAGEKERKWMDFRTPGSYLKFEPAVSIDQKYTVCTWMLFPTPAKHASIWQAPPEGGGAVYSDDTELFGWSRQFGGDVNLGKFPEEMAGWHHIALTADGTTTRAFLDGKELGNFDGVILRKIGTIGNHWNVTYTNRNMCNALDDQFIFRRPLSADEIQKVMKFERPRDAK